MLVIVALALVGPSALLCELRCATQETQAAGGTPVDTCAGHDGHSSASGAATGCRRVAAVQGLRWAHASQD